MSLKNSLVKIRNYFTEEVEDEKMETIRKEVIQVPIPAPEQKEELKSEESSVLKKEERNNAPIYFDDKDFADLPIRENKETIKKEPSYKERVVKKEEKKYFRPSPIISPVYGVLDKNYYKEDIATKKRTTVDYQVNDSLTIDDVRKKAFGTLEDDLEKNLFGTNSILFNEDLEENNDVVINEDDIFDSMFEDAEIETLNQEKTVLENDEPDITFEQHTKIDINFKDNDVKEEFEKTEDEITESDLFNLIDSMYEGKDLE